VTSRRARAIASFLVPSLTVAILLYQVLANLQIGFTRSETLVVIGLLLGVAVAAGVVAALAAGWVRIAIFALSTLLLLDVALQLPEVFGRLHPAQVLGLPAAVVAVYLAFWYLRERIHAILFVFLVVTLGATIVTQPRLHLPAAEANADGADRLVESWSAQGPFNEDLPVVFHIVLDEMMSPGGMTEDLPGGVETRRALYDLGDRHGLRTYDAVYSRDFFTARALPNLMAADYQDSRRLDAIEADLDAAENAYFDDMAARGYRTIVFQTSHLDFCLNPNVAACETFNSYNPGGEGYDGLDLRSRTLNLWNTLLRAYEPSYASTYGGMLLRRHYDLGSRAVGVIGHQDRFDVQRFPDWFDRFTGFARRAPRGTHIFAHLMVPHAPYLLTPGCAVSGTFYTSYYMGTHYPTDADRERARLLAYSDYLQQVRCIARQVDGLLRTLAQIESFRDATIVIHGDHGSRISTGHFIEDHAPRDFVDNYATYYAIKGPDVEPGIDCELVSLPEIFRRHMTPISGPPPPGRAPLPVIVSSRDREGTTVEAPMPEFGCAAEGA
jgi:hypothetical protein